MSEKSQVVPNAVEAHGWVGLIISVPLFIIFWAGAITLFYPEVQRWASLPHYPVVQPANQSEQPAPPLTELINDKTSAYLYDNTRRMSVTLLGESSPYIRMFIPVFNSEADAQLAASQRQAQSLESGAPQPEAQPDTKSDASASVAEEKPASNEFQQVLIDPYTGVTLAEENPFQLASFINRLHFTLKLPQGLYIVGVMTLFFLVLVFTGLVIQFKNIFRNFFLYRHKKTLRYKMNDMHTVVGVIAMPFGLMYALTGVMFNLTVVFQVATLFGLYGGDTKTMLADAGVANFHSKPAHVAAPMPNLDDLLLQVENDDNIHVSRLRLMGWGDENAEIMLSGVVQGSFSDRVTRVYSVAEGQFPPALNTPGTNLFSDGTDILFSMHMGSFAGVDLRLVYFILALGFCGMIVAGNVLWIAKRQKRNSYPKIFAVTRGLTLGACVAIMPATALAFVLERHLPLGLADRSDLITYVFGVVLLIGVIAAFINSNYKRFVAGGCLATAVLLALLVMVDGLIYGSTLVALWRGGFVEPASITLAMLIVALICAWVGKAVLRTAGVPATVRATRRGAKAATV